MLPWNTWQLSDTNRAGLAGRLFIHYQLSRLQLGETLIHITYGNMPRRIASTEELLAARPDLTDAR